MVIHGNSKNELDGDPHHQFSNSNKRKHRFPSNPRRYGMKLLNKINNKRAYKINYLR